MKQETTQKDNKQENKIKEFIKTFKEEEITKESYATRKRIIFKKQKRLFKAKQKLAHFEEPILILMRSTGKAEWYENATGGKFTFTHSNKEERFIILDQSFMQTFEYGGNTFKGYICHEDFPTPLPDNPIVTTELVAIMYEKVLNDISKWKVEQEKAKALKIRSWAILLAVAGGIILLYIVLKKPNEAIQIAQNISQNLTNATKTTTMTIIQ